MSDLLSTEKVDNIGGDLCSPELIIIIINKEKYDGNLVFKIMTLKQILILKLCYNQCRDTIPEYLKTNSSTMLFVQRVGTSSREFTIISKLK